MKYQVLMDFVSKALLVKASSFHASTKRNFFVMAAITAVIKINRSMVLFNILVDMVVKHSSGFAMQINKMLIVLGAPISTSQDQSKTKMLDAENVLALRPKIYVLYAASIKKEIGEAQASTTKKK